MEENLIHDYTLKTPSHSCVFSVNRCDANWNAASALSGWHSALFAYTLNLSYYSDYLFYFHQEPLIGVPQTL